jgi:hypothetical protein
MFSNLPYSPIHSQEWLEKFLKKNYYTKKYDRFMWWRSFTPRNSPLSSRHPLRDRIINGDFDLGSFVFEVELVEHRINQKFQEIGHDYTQYHEAISLDRARIKRLKEDRDKDEARKLEELKKAFITEFKMSKEDYEREIVLSYKDLLSFYDKMEKKFGRYWKPAKNVPKDLRLASERC